MQIRLIRIYLTIALFTGALLLNAGAAFAHKVTVFAWVDGDTIYGESKFSGGRRAKGAEVIVTDPDGNQLLTTKTDDNGEFSFKIPRKTEMKIELIAGMGHRGEWTIQADEIGEIAAAAESSGKTEEKPVAVSVPEPEPLQKVTPVSSATPDSDEIQAAVEKALDKKLKPVLKMLAESQQKGPTVNDIIGGIGYIFGLMGVLMYAKARQLRGGAAKS